MAAAPYLVFVSHASADKWIAEQVARSIEDAGGDVFFDTVDIEKGDQYDAKILDALRRCEELIVLMTPTASESKNVWMEIGAVWYAEKRLIGILYSLSVDEVQADPRMPQGFRRLQLLSLNDTDRYLDQVARRIREEADS